MQEQLGEETESHQGDVHQHERAFCEEPARTISRTMAGGGQQATVCQGSSAVEAQEEAQR